MVQTRLEALEFEFNAKPIVAVTEKVGRSLILWSWCLICPSFMFHVEYDFDFDHIGGHT